MTIAAKFASICAACHKPIRVGDKIEWSKGSPATHARLQDCAAAPVASMADRPTSRPARPSYSRRTSTYSRACGAAGCVNGCTDCA